MGPAGTIEVEIHSPLASIVTLRGEHDLNSTAQIAVALAVAGDCESILVDVSDSTFIDSSVIGALLRAAKQTRKRDGTLELVAPREARAVRRALELAGVQDLLPFHETRGAGITSIESAERPRATGQAGLGLSSVSAKIERLQAKTDSSRASRVARQAGVVVIRADVATTRDDETSADAPDARRPAA